MQQINSFLIYDGDDDIINQYIAFCRKTDECRLKYPKDARKAVTEAIDSCIASGILANYLAKRKPEVININGWSRPILFIDRLRLFFVAYESEFQ